jgi:hypothetical protein
MGSYGSEQSSIVGICEHGNENSGSIKGGEFLDKLRDHKLIKNDSISQC